MTLKSKKGPYGLVELRQEGSMYVLYVAGSIKGQSSDLNFMMREFDRY